MPAKDKKKDEVSLVRCETSSGPIAMEFHREWSPRGYDRAIELFERGFFDTSHFFRVVPKFLVQFGIS
jgi:cyclophilin family peptidyl-prolyl cis-trans isomerase